MNVDKVVKPEMKIEYTPGKVVVELTFVEAAVLLSLCNTAVTGPSGERSARGATDEIGAQLKRAGVPLMYLFMTTAHARDDAPHSRILETCINGDKL